MSAIDFHTLPSEHGSRPRSLFGYDVIDYIGQGAGSLIYVVSDPRSNQLYALKHVERKTDKHARFVDQLVNEYEVSKRLSHPNLRKALDMKETKTWLGKVTEAVLVLELFDGSPLETNPPASALEAVQIFIQVAKGLEALHQSGYVDCDLKPNNILVAADGHVKVIDFGQACKIGTVKERIQGTPDFIAPEQVKRDAVTVRTDIFNLGATLYWALAGKHIPTLYTIKRDENSFLLHDKIPTPTDLNPAVPETLSNLVMECVRINPAKRPESMADVQRRLEIIEHTLKKRQMN
ncbi:MAG: serine/threonine-protein kinase [Phycisphaerae bacterium]